MNVFSVSPAKSSQPLRNCIHKNILVEFGTIQTLELLNFRTCFNFCKEKLKLYFTTKHERYKKNITDPGKSCELLKQRAAYLRSLGCGNPMVWDTLQGTTLSQGKQALTGQGHGPDKQTPIWQEMARFGSIFLAGKMCNSNTFDLVSHHTVCFFEIIQMCANKFFNTSDIILFQIT